jgi:hypothetical protein
VAETDVAALADVAASATATVAAAAVKRRNLVIF